MPHATDPTMPAPALSDDASFTPPEQPPMLDDGDASGLVNGQEDKLTDDGTAQSGR